MKNVKFGFGKVMVLMAASCLMGAALMVIGEQQCSRRHGGVR